MRPVTHSQVIVGAALLLALAVVCASGAAPATPVAPTPPSGHQPPSPKDATTPSPRDATTPSMEIVTLKVLGIRAANEPKPHVDPALQSIANELRRTKYNSFYALASEPRVVAAGAATEVPLVEGYSLRIMVEKITGDNVQLALSWIRTEKDAQGRPQAKTLQRVQMTMRRGKYFLSGGWSLADGALWAGVSAP